MGTAANITAEGLRKDIPNLADKGDRELEGLLARVWMDFLRRAQRNPGSLGITDAQWMSVAGKPGPFQVVISGKIVDLTTIDYHPDRLSRIYVTGDSEAVAVFLIRFLRLVKEQLR